MYQTSSKMSEGTNDISITQAVAASGDGLLMIPVIITSEFISTPVYYPVCFNMRPLLDMNPMRQNIDVYPKYIAMWT